MASIDLAQVERRVRRRYEWSRAKQAVVGFSPVFLVIALATLLARQPSQAGGFGAATFLAGAAMLWYGREPQRAVLPGVLAGFVPLSLALCANHLHVCTGNGCVALCIPACSVGGLIAGYAVARVGKQRRAGASFWLSASALALLMGAMGCACVGYSGILGLGLGFTVFAVPGWLSRARLGPAR
jgi:hypothetical protein